MLPSRFREQTVSHAATWNTSADAASVLLLALKTLELAR
jgi:hypothetical protein